MSLEQGAAPPSVLCQEPPRCLLGPWGSVGPTPWHGPRPSLPVSLGPLGRGSRGSGAGRATCCLPLGVLEGLKDHFQGWQDLGRVSGSGWGIGLPSCHLSRPGWDWLPSPHFVLRREESAGQARCAHALLLVRGCVVESEVPAGPRAVLLRGPGLEDAG